MVIRPHPPVSDRRARRRRRGVLSAELAVAVAIFTAGMLPLAFTVLHDQKRARALYRRAVAIEIVDGELEILAAGGWRKFPPGKHVYAVDARAAKNLPQGAFTLERDETGVRLEWRPDRSNEGGPVRREFKFPAQP